MAEFCSLFPKLKKNFKVLKASTAELRGWLSKGQRTSHRGKAGQVARGELRALPYLFEFHYLNGLGSSISILQAS